MGKRPHSDVERAEPSRHAGGKRRKQGGKDDKPDSTVWTKNRIRSIERLLRKDQGMPQDARAGMERELVSLRDNLGEAAFQKKRAAMISKYHMVRFFERKKAMRLAKQLERRLNDCTDPDDRAKLERDLHVARVDEAYAQHHPHAEPYISLYPKSGAREAQDSNDDDDDDEGDDQDAKPASAKTALASEKPPMWAEIEKTMALGPAALRKLRERRPAAGDDGAGPAKKKPGQKPHGQDAAKKDGAPKTGYDAFKSRPAAAVPQRALKGPNGQSLNRRERRKLMHKGQPLLRKDDDDDDDEEEEEGGFFTSGI